MNTSFSQSRGILKATALAALASVAVLSTGPAFAQDTATFNVTGKLLPACGYQSTDVAFPLGDVPLSKFANPGSFSDEVEAQLISLGCSGVARVKMRFEAPADSADPTLFAVTGGGAGVGIELRSFDGVLAEPNGAWITWAPRGNGEGYRYKARYKSTGERLVAGDANASIVVHIEYE